MAKIPAKHLTLPPSVNTTLHTERLTIDTLNTVPNLAKTPTATSKVKLLVNSTVVSESETPAPFTRVAKVITWVSGDAGYDLETTDEVIAEYETTE